MAIIRFDSGKKFQRLANLIEKYNYNVTAAHSKNEVGIDYICQIEGSCIVVTREMVSKAYFNDKPEYEASVDKLLDFIALNRQGKLICHTRDKIVICDDDTDKAMSLRMKLNHQMDIARLSEKLGISRNDFVVRAIEHYVQYLTSIEEMEE